MKKTLNLITYNDAGQYWALFFQETHKTSICEWPNYFTYYLAIIFFCLAWVCILIYLSIYTNKDRNHNGLWLFALFCFSLISYILFCNLFQVPTITYNDSVVNDLNRGIIQRHIIPQSDRGPNFVGSARLFVPEGTHQISKYAWAVYQAKDNDQGGSLTKLTGIILHDISGEERGNYVWGKQLAIGLYELKQRNVSAINTMNTRNNPVILECLKACAAQVGAYHTETNVPITNALIDHLAEKVYYK